MTGGLTFGQLREWVVMQADAPEDYCGCEFTWKGHTSRSLREECQAHCAEPAPCACTTGELNRDGDGPVWCVACVAEGGTPCAHAFGSLTCSGPSTLTRYPEAM